MSVMHNLLTRAMSDLGVQEFLEKVFLILSGELKQCRLVCKEWDMFIISLWGQRGKLLTKLKSNWERGIPCSEREVLLGGRCGGKVERMCADDTILVTVMDSNRIIVISCATMEVVAVIRDFEHCEDYNVTDLEVEVSQSYILACHTVRDTYLYDPPQTEVMISLYDKQGQMVGAKRITLEEVFWSFKVAFSDSHMGLLIKSRMSVYKLNDKNIPKFNDIWTERKYLTLVYTIKKISGLVTVLKVAGSTFVTGDVGGSVKFWDAQTGVKLRTVEIGSPVQDVQFYGACLVTVGGINGAMGVSFWDYETGELVKSLYGEVTNQENGCFIKVTVNGNIILLDGYSQAILFSVNTGDWRVKEILRLRSHVVASNRSCVFKARYQEFDGQISVKDFWNEQFNVWKIFPSEF